MGQNLVAEFQRRFIKGGERVLLSDQTVSAFRKGNWIFILSVQNRDGVITDDRRRQLASCLQGWNTEEIFVTLFDDMNDFSAWSDKVSWGSYAWIMSEPDHTIHFDSVPTLQPRQTV